MPVCAPCGRHRLGGSVDWHMAEVRGCMSVLDKTLDSIAPKVSVYTQIPGAYMPRHGLAMYFLPMPGAPEYSPSAPAMVLGEALAAHSGLPCTLLEGIPDRIPNGALILGEADALRTARPDLMHSIPRLDTPGQYAIQLQDHALLTANSPEGLGNAMQTLAMMLLRHAEPVLPGVLIVDTPKCTYRGLAVELHSHEITAQLLLQIASFACTFKANHIQFILDADFDPSQPIDDMDAFYDVCRSYRLKVEVRLPWLGMMLAGAQPLHKTWARLRSIAELFGAGSAAMDDPCPANTDPVTARTILDAMADSDDELKISFDAALFEAAGAQPGLGMYAHIPAWQRIRSTDTSAPASPQGHVRLDVEAHLPGFSSRTAAAFRARLDSARAWLDTRTQREMFISFRGIGVSHLWQNLLCPAATGLIAAWGNPPDAAHCEWAYASLLYGSAARAVLDMWDKTTAAFPTGLSAENERLLRQTAFGAWPQDDAHRALLANIDWSEVISRVRDAAKSITTAVEKTTRNAATLSGAKLALQALAWLHCIAVLVPELERRKTMTVDDGRTKAIATELESTCAAWQENIKDLYLQTGLEVPDLPQIDAMVVRVRQLCSEIA